jgi:DNA topoisomerase-1
LSDESHLPAPTESAPDEAPEAVGAAPRPATRPETGKATATKKKTASKKKAAPRKKATGKKPAARKPAAARGPAMPEGGHLVIVESPGKIKSLTRYLTPILDGPVMVKASFGHVRDLVKKGLGVDTEGTFEPTYEVLAGSKKAVSEIKSAAKKAGTIWLATDLDREGEAIAWHVAAAAGLANGTVDERVKRVEFSEITPEAMEYAFSHERAINWHLVDAQQTRRILDRIIGFKLSPVLWKVVRGGVGTGRVQSVALRLVVDREREIQAFVPVEYWTVEVPFETDAKEGFTSSLFSIGGTKIEINNEADANTAVEAIRAAGTYTVTEVRKRQQKQNPPRPFITSTLQQEASRKLGFGARRTMMLAQQLYEGVDGGEGFITYMRTDSVHLAPGAVGEVRELIKKRFGDKYLPDKPPVFKSKKGAQEAHEAVRPTHPRRTPEDVARSLDADQLKLYRLIWERTMACQMTEAQFDATSVDISAGDYLLRATGRVMLFDGFLAVYREGRDDEEEEDERRLPELTEGQTLNLVDVIPTQHFTQPPPRFTEASLVKALEEFGIGRPSTYAATLSRLTDHDYVSIDQRRIFPTDRGMVVTDLLVEHFPEIPDVAFTARMEEDLDEIAEGHKDWPEVLRVFFDPFERLVEKKAKEIKRDDLIKETTDELCPKCNGPMMIKLGRFGKFISCANYPECKGTRQIDGTERPEPQEVPGEKCELCESPLLLRHGRFGPFVGCSNYPKCKYIKKETIGGTCPKCDKGKLQQRRSKRRTTFYGCTRYPDCDYVMGVRPLEEACTKCGGTMAPDEERGGICQSCGHALQGDPVVPAPAVALKEAAAAKLAEAPAARVAKKSESSSG